jgi:Flp pilus assembly protein TadG
MRLKPNKRGGAVAVESAIVLPVAVGVLVAIVSGALAVSTYQQVAAMSREASRYASVRGQQYSQSTGKPPATATDVYNDVISQRLINMDPNNLTYSVTWNPDNKPGSTVTVTITYQMSVPIYGTMTFTSTATSQVTW